MNARLGAKLKEKKKCVCVCVCEREREREKEREIMRYIDKTERKKGFRNN